MQADIDLSPDALARWRKLAEGASPGPWTYDDEMGCVIDPSCQEIAEQIGARLTLETPGDSLLTIRPVGDVEAEATINAAFIAASHPQAVLALLTRVEKLQAALAFYANPFNRRDENGEEIGVPDYYDEMEFGERAREALSSG